MNKLANSMENGEFDFDGTHDKKVRHDLHPHKHTRLANQHRGPAGPM